jgi:hypothetical protein
MLPKPIKRLVNKGAGYFSRKDAENAKSKYLKRYMQNM